VSGYLKKEPRFLLGTETGVGTAHSALLHGHRLRDQAFDPVPGGTDTGSAVIWRQTPAAGQAPVRWTRQKPAFAWRYPP